MKSIFKFFIISFCGFLIFLTSNAGTKCLTTINFSHIGWDDSIPSGQSAIFASDSAPSIKVFQQSESDQTGTSKVCYGPAEYINVTVRGPKPSYAVLAKYLSINPYNSTDQPTVNFPVDFRMIP